jgi:hypothetical protein
MNGYKLINVLSNAKTPKEIFGVLSGSDKKEQKEELKGKFDRFQRELTSLTESKEVLRAQVSLKSWYFVAILKVQEGIYLGESELFLPQDPLFSFSSGKIRYDILWEIRDHDGVKIYKGILTESRIQKLIGLKVVFDESYYPLMRHEADVLKSLYDGNREFERFLPELIQNVTLDNGYSANVFEWVNGAYNLSFLKEAFSDGLPLEHVVWIADRLLGSLGNVHSKNVLHAGLSMDCINVIPSIHNVYTVGWFFAIKDMYSLGKKYVGKNGYSAPEINKYTKPHPRTDIYSLGVVLLELLGGNIETKEFPSGTDYRFVKFLKSFIKDDPDRRADDAWVLWHELGRLRKDIFGSDHQFLPLVIDEI